MDLASPQLVMMEGPAGVGKSTLAESLCAAVGNAVLLPEEAIFEFPEFALVGAAFRTKVWPTPTLMLDAYRDFFGRVSGSSVIADWNALGMIEDLPCAQVDRKTLTSRLPDVRADFDVLATHARDVLDVAAIPCLLLVLEAPAPMAGQRAAKQRGEEWIAKQMEYLEPHDGETLDACIVRNAMPRRRRREDLVRAHQVGGWSVITIDATAPADVVLASALMQLSA